MTKIKPPTNNTAAVNEYMENLDYPLKAEVQAVREIIKAVDPGIIEQIKWNAPSFTAQDYLHQAVDQVQLLQS